MFPFKDKVLLTTQGSLDLYGQATGVSEQVIDCSIISLLETPQLTSTGQDVSASRGRAGQDVLVSKIITPLKIKIVHGDTITVGNGTDNAIKMQVISVLQKTNVLGKPCFNEVRLVQAV